MIIIDVLSGLFFVVILFVIFLTNALTRFFITKTHNKPESSLEHKMYKAFRSLGVEPICQKPVGPYRLDFAIIKEGVKLDVECDGPHHYTAKQKRKDVRRNNYLKLRGWYVKRLPYWQIEENPHKCAEEAIEYLALLTNFHPSWRRFWRMFY